jgi:hypothetical protein
MMLRIKMDRLVLKTMDDGSPTAQIICRQSRVPDPTRLRTTRSTTISPPATAEAGESPAALVQAYFLAKAWVSESVWAYV